MNKKYLIYILLLFITPSWLLAQEQLVELDAPLTVEYDEVITAGERIVIKSGFNFTAKEDKGLRLNIDEYFMPLTLTTLAPKIDGATPSVSIYPNPVGQTLHVDSKTDEEIKKIEIFTLTGFRVLSNTDLATINSFDVGRLSQGVHVVVVETKTDNLTFRIVKK